jgi:hypothetical protein
VLRRGRCEQSLRAPGGFGRQQRRALEEGGGGRKAPAHLGSAGRALELLRDLLVGPGRGLSPVPGASVGIGVCVGRLRQRAVDVLSLLKRR